MFLNKEPRANRISRRVETRIVLLNEEHLINGLSKKCLSIAEFLCLNNNTLMLIGLNEAKGITKWVQLIWDERFYILLNFYFKLACVGHSKAFCSPQT